MKTFKRFFAYLLIIVFVVVGTLYFSGNIHLLKAVKSTYLVGKTGPTIDDFVKFENRTVEKGSSVPWRKHANYNQVQLDVADLAVLEKWESTAFLVIKDEQLLYEKYWDSYSAKSLTNSFSMAKSLTSLCIGAAIKEGKIQGVDQSVGDFLPEFAEGEKSKITIKHLLQMNSGVDFGESYGDPFGFMAKTYYGTDLYDLTVEKEVKHPAGEIWHYQGGNTLLLSFILEKATGKRLADYFSEKFWVPLQAEEEALWSLNKANGIEKSYCCFYSNARDFARIGQLMLDSGQWNGISLINKVFYVASLQATMTPKESGKMVDYYGYQWWFNKMDGTPYYYARGIQGQYILFVPEWNLVLVRLGHKRDTTRGVTVPADLIEYLAIAKKIAG